MAGNRKVIATSLPLKHWDSAASDHSPACAPVQCAKFADGRYGIEKV
jgi:hypothetical protein